MTDLVDEAVNPLSLTSRRSRQGKTSKVSSGGGSLVASPLGTNSL